MLGFSFVNQKGRFFKMILFLLVLGIPRKSWDPRGLVLDILENIIIANQERAIDFSEGINIANQEQDLDFRDKYKRKPGTGL